MTDAQIRSLIARYVEVLAKLTPEKTNTSVCLNPSDHTSHVTALKHVRWMLDEMFEMVRPDRLETQDLMRQLADREKIQRWLGFVQCAMWSHGLLSIDTLRNDIVSMRLREDEMERLHN